MCNDDFKTLVLEQLYNWDAGYGGTTLNLQLFEHNCFNSFYQLCYSLILSSTIQSQQSTPLHRYESLKIIRKVYDHYDSSHRCAASKIIQKDYDYYDSSTWTLLLWFGLPAPSYTIHIHGTSWYDLYSTDHDELLHFTWLCVVREGPKFIGT